MNDYLGYFSGGFLVTLAGLALLAIARWRSEVLGRPMRDATGTLFLVPGWLMALLGSLLMFVMLANVLGFLLWLVLLVVLVMACTQRRIGRRRALLRLLAAATRSRRPLAPVVAAFARETQGAVGRQALLLNAALESGAPLGNALAIVGPLASSRERALLYLGQQTNELTGALEAAADEQEPDTAAGEIMANMAYLFWVLVFGATVLTFVMLKIVPAFKQIFEDFGTELPAMTLLLINMSSLVAALWPLVLLFQIAVWGGLVYSLLIYVGWIQWRMPLPLRWMRGLDTSSVLRGLALTAEANRPMDHGLAALATAYSDPWVRRQLELVTIDVAAGLPWWESLWLRRLISAADCSLLEAAQRLGNLPWALRSVADWHRWRLTYRLRWWLHVLAPPLLVAVGMVVGFVVLALFLPLVKIIETLT